LRAAELAAFGMEGVGAIYRAYADGALEDDDEVAVAHAAAEHDHRPLSEAMVNLRATLAAAEAAGALSAAARGTLESVAKALPFADRSLHAVLALAGAAGVAPEEVASLRGFLVGGRVDQKR